jgi:hypothetical protein
VNDTEVELSALIDADVAASSGVEHGDVLLAFADAMVGRDDPALTRARDAILQTLGPEALVDAAGVASNFERMVRIADATGIPLDDRMMNLTKEVRDELLLDRFAAVKETI